jgi:hypothetical protein
MLSKMLSNMRAANVRVRYQYQLATYVALCYIIQQSDNRDG